MSLDDMDTLEQSEMKKIRPINNTLFDWLINYIPEPTRKSEGNSKDKIASLFKTNTRTYSVWERKETNKTKYTKQN